MQREIHYDEVFDAQKHYRLLLDSMARPGKINTLPDAKLLPPAGIPPASVLVAFALLNADVTFCAVGVNRNDIADYLLLNTASASEALSLADFIFLSGIGDGNELLEAKTGTLAYPENSATFIVDVEEISEQPLSNSQQLTLRGPGVPGEKNLFIRGLHPAFLENLQAQNLEFPLGIDVVLIDKASRVIGLPRSNRFTWKESREG